MTFEKRLEESEEVNHATSKGRLLWRSKQSVPRPCGRNMVEMFSDRKKARITQGGTKEK
jgi:hypothetical protein